MSTSMLFFLLSLVYWISDYLSNYIKTNKNRTKFQSFCTVHQGSLVEVDDIEEYNAVTDVAKNHSEYYIFFIVCVWHMYFVRGWS